MDRPDLNANGARLQAFGLQSLAMPAEPARVTAPASIAPAAGAARSFGGLYGELHQEITRYIASGAEADGGWDTPSAGNSLSAEAQARLAQLQGAPAAEADAGTPSEAQQAFLSSIAPWAAEAGERLGVSPDIIAAHAALESGWGQRPLRNAEGTSTHNLFGIKAQGGWQGSSAEALTTEYEDGSAVKKSERFRSYDDPAGAFRDFSRLLLESPRYHGALNTGSDARSYAQALARGGYATDPAYADKLTRVAARVLGAQSAGGD